MDFSIVYPEIKKSLTTRHRAFLKKFGPETVQIAQEKELVVDKVYAKIVLVAKMMQEMGAISGFQEVDLTKATSEYSRSIMLTSRASLTVIYLLNASGDVIITDSVGTASADPLDARLVLVSDSRKVLVKHKDVLNERFLWAQLCSDVLEAIHSSLYDKAAAVKLFEDRLGARG